MNNAQQKEINQQCLYLALMELLKQKSIEKVTIGELCDNAGVSRMTFYRSYNYKEDILMQHLEECFNRFLSILQENDYHTHYDISLCFFHFWQTEERDFLLMLITAGLSAQLMERFYHYLDLVYQKVKWVQSVPSYISSFLAGGLYKLLIDWMKDETKATPEELAEFLSTGGNALHILASQ